MKPHIDIEILELLLAATRSGKMRWMIDEDCDKEDSFHAELDGRHFEIAFIYLQRSGEKTAECAMARIQSKALYETYAAGTDGYRLLMDILEECIWSWKGAAFTSQKKKEKLRDALKKAVESASPD